MALVMGVYLAGEIYQRRDYLPYFLEQQKKRLVEAFRTPVTCLFFGDSAGAEAGTQN